MDYGLDFLHFIRKMLDWTISHNSFLYSLSYFLFPSLYTLCPLPYALQTSVCTSAKKYHRKGL